MKKASLALAVSVGLCSPAIWATTQIDVLGLYTPDTAKGFKQEHVAQMQHSVNVANKVLKDSGLDINVNLAATKEVQYDTQPGLKKSQSEVLYAATPSNRLDPALRMLKLIANKLGRIWWLFFATLMSITRPIMSVSRMVVTQLAVVWLGLWLLQRGNIHKMQRKACIAIAI